MSAIALPTGRPAHDTARSRDFLQPMVDKPSLWTVGPHRGFLPRSAAVPLPTGSTLCAPFAAAASLAAALPESSDEAVGAAVQALACPDPQAFHDLAAEEIEGGLQTYSFIAARLIHAGLLSDARVLPACVAIPLWTLALAVDRRPALTYATYVLANWDGPLFPRAEPDSIHVAQTFSGTDDERWFIAVHLSIETLGGEIVACLADCEVGTRSDPQLITRGLLGISDALCWATSTLKRIRERLQPHIFSERVRPFLFGYENVRFGGVPGLPSVSYAGETGAQSGVIRAVDAALGVRHVATVKGALRRFSAYAPLPHQQYLISAMVLGARVAALAAADPLVRSAYVVALEALLAFREEHVSVVSDYLSSALTLGTGGTRHGFWLDQLCQDVRQQILSVRADD